MKKLALFALISFSFFNSSAQDFSNKGTDFWVGYGFHVRYVGNTQDMVLYFAIGDDATNIKVEIPGVGYSITYNNIPANTIFESQPIPKSGLQDARLPSEGIYNRGIHITATKPVVAYAHIYNTNVSGASLLFPTNTLGKEYYSINYTQRSNETASNGFFFVIATDTGTTSVEITPAANTIGGQAAGIPFTVNLTQGQIYNVMGTITGNTGVDLTGSKIRSISSGTGGCKKIAVYSGSGKMSINCGTNQASSADNLIQQAFPKSAWGKKYLTTPTAQMPNNFFRICVSDPLTNVTVNGLPITGITNNFYYDLPVSNSPNRIEADQPIMVAQYMTTAAMNNNNSTCGNNHPFAQPGTGELGDPEMIYLSPIEQTIDKVTLNSTGHSDIRDHWINIIIKTSAISSVRLDGVPVAGWQVHNQDPGFAYAQVNVGVGAHRIQADSGFNAIAYGYGPAESYGYNAGTNIRDLFNFITPLNPLNISGTNTACAGTQFVFSITYPFIPTSLFWNFYGFQTPNVTQNNPVFDSTYLINGKQVWRYKLPGFYSYPAGNFPISITAGTSGSDGCGNFQVKDDTLYVFPQPIHRIGLVHTGCLTDSVYFKDSTVFPNGSFAYKWYWDFGDGTTSTLKNPSHLYASQGNYTVKLSTVTNVGCFGDTVTRQVNIAIPPTANFGVSVPRCIGQVINFTDSSMASAGGTIGRWFWDYGDGVRDTLTSNPNRTHIYNNAGVYTVTLKVESAGGCQSLVASRQITVSAYPVANFSFTAVCLPNGITQFTNLSTISDGTQSSLVYLWNFGDPGSGAANSSSLKDPQHAYSTPGPFNVTLTVISISGCSKDSTKILTQVYARPTAAFNVTPELCLNQVSIFTDQSNGQGNTLTEWYWDFGDGQFSTIQNPTHSYTLADTFIVKLYVKNDKGCFSDTVAKQVIIYPLPIAQFAASTPTCANKAITFTSTSTSAAGSIIAWKWNMGDGNIFTRTNGNPFTYTYGATGSYNVTLSVETDKTCVSPNAALQVVISPVPRPGFVTPDVCLTDAFAQFTDTSSISDGSQAQFTYLWNFGDPGSGILNTSTIKNPQHIFSAVGVYNVSLTVTSNKGCDSTLVKSFTVNGSVPDAQFSVLNPNNICSLDSVRIQNNSTVDFGSLTKIEVYWDFANNPTVFVTDNNPLTNGVYSHKYPAFTTPATRTYRVRMRSFSGGTCVDEIIKDVVINANPGVTFSALPNVCTNAAAFQITQAVVAGNLPGTGVYSGPGVSTSGVFNPVIAGPGTHIIKFRFTSNAGCADSAQQSITVAGIATSTFSVSAAKCVSLPVTFTDNSSTPSGNIVSWSWNFNDGSPIVTFNNNAPFTHTFPNAVSYNVQLTITTSLGCNKDTTITVNINPLPVPDFSFNEACLPNAAVQFTDASSIPDGTQGQFTYLWNFGDPSSGVLNSSAAKDPVHVYKSAGPFSVSLTVTSGNGCPKTIVKSFDKIHERPQAIFMNNPDAICVGGIISLQEGSNGGDTTLREWHWDFGDNTNSTIQNPPPHTYNVAGNYKIRLYVINDRSCVSDTFENTITVNDFPNVDAGADRDVLEGGTIVLNPIVTGNGLSYLWTPDRYISGTTLKNPVVSGVQNITYTLTVVGAGGCSDSDKVNVRVLKFPVIPNTFTPNGDGINDFWVITALNTYPESRVQVFSRYGQLVYESKGYPAPWNGTQKGKPLPFGTYYYVIEPGSGRKPITGYVTLIK